MREIDLSFSVVRLVPVVTFQWRHEWILLSSISSGMVEDSLFRADRGIFACDVRSMEKV
jgi:hypothetical protein